MARTPNTEAKSARKGKQVSATIRPELFDALDEYRWSAKLNGMTEVTRVALEEYAVNHGVEVAAEAPAAGE